MAKILIIDSCRECSHRYWVGDKSHCFEKNGRLIKDVLKIPKWCELDDAEVKDA